MLVQPLTRHTRVLPAGEGGARESANKSSDILRKLLYCVRETWLASMGRVPTREPCFTLGGSEYVTFLEQEMR